MVFSEYEREKNEHSRAPHKWAKVNSSTLEASYKDLQICCAHPEYLSLCRYFETFGRALTASTSRLRAGVSLITSKPSSCRSP